MKHVHYSKVNLETPTEEGIKDIKVRWLISKKDDANRFAMRLFEVQPGGYSPLHQHDWEHEVFILEGQGVVRDKTMERPCQPGDVLFIKPMEWHQLANTGTSIMKFICLVPYIKK